MIDIPRPRPGRCPDCGGDTYEFPAPPDAGHVTEVRCTKCGVTHFWLDGGCADPADYEMPDGRLKGRPLGEADDGHLKWLTANHSRVLIRELARRVLARRADLRRGRPRRGVEQDDAGGRCVMG